MFRFIDFISVPSAVIFCSFGALLFFVSCAGLPPIKEYSFAREALLQAKKYRADKNYPQYYAKALKLYRAGKASFKDRYFNRAGDLFREAVEYAERSEDLTRVKRAGVGDHGF